jgi:hypothetical protein
MVHSLAELAYQEMREVLSWFRQEARERALLKSESERAHILSQLVAMQLSLAQGVSLVSVSRWNADC